MRESPRLFLISAMLSIVLLSSAVGLAASSYDVKHEAENGMAFVGFDAGILNNFSVAARLQLPAVTTNKSWYCIWLMVGEDRNDTTDVTKNPAFLQGGIMRYEQSDFRAQPFVATRHAGENLAFHGIEKDIRGEHEFAIIGTPNRISVLMDGKQIFSVPRSEYFKPHQEMQIKLAAEVYADGDLISGTARELRLKINGKTFDWKQPYSSYAGRGLKLECSEKTLTAIGKFEPDEPSKWFTLGCGSAAGGRSRSPRINQN